MKKHRQFVRSPHKKRGKVVNKMSKRGKKDDADHGLGGGGSQKKKKAAANTGKAKCEEEDVEEEEDRKMTPSEQKMAGLDKEIKVLIAKIEGYETERNQCADEKRRDKLTDLITARGNNLTELLRQQNARAQQGSFLPSFLLDFIYHDSQFSIVILFLCFLFPFFLFTVLMFLKLP
jgi:hypothetical protein